MKGWTILLLPLALAACTHAPEPGAPSPVDSPAWTPPANAVPVAQALDRDWHDPIESNETPRSVEVCGELEATFYSSSVYAESGESAYSACGSLQPPNGHAVFARCQDLLMTGENYCTEDCGCEDDKCSTWGGRSHEWDWTNNTVFYPEEDEDGKYCRYELPITCKCTCKDSKDPQPND